MFTDFDNEYDANFLADEDELLLSFALHKLLIRKKESFARIMNGTVSTVFRQRHKIKYLRIHFKCQTNHLKVL